MSVRSRVLRFVLRSVAALALLVVVVTAGFTAAIAYPQPFFAHSVTTNNITVRSAAPLDEDTVAGFLETLDWSPAVAGLPEWQVPVTVYVTGSGWRFQLFFPITPFAGGVTYAGIAPRHIFLSGADFYADRLLKDDTVIAPPRTLTYYLRHEATHLAQARDLGFVAYSTRPHWVREGMADLAALGRPDAERIVAAIGDGPVQLGHRIAFAAYPRAWVLADWALDQFGYEFLLTTDWDTDTAWAEYRAATRQRERSLQ